MTTFSEPGFAIRRNSDGSLDAICLKCFVTAGTTKSELELTTVEQAHQCDPVQLERLSGRFSPTSV